MSNSAAVAIPDPKKVTDTRLPPQRTSPHNNLPIPQALIDLDIHADDGSLPTLSDIARATGYTLPHMSKVFGKKRAPSYRCAAAIAQFLGVRVEKLYEALGIKVEPFIRQVQ